MWESALTRVTARNGLFMVCFTSRTCDPSRSGKQKLKNKKGNARHCCPTKPPPVIKQKPGLLTTGIFDQNAGTRKCDRPASAIFPSWRRHFADEIFFALSRCPCVHRRANPFRGRLRRPFRPLNRAAASGRAG